VANHNPRDIIANIRRLIAGEEQEPMIPYFDGFVGEIVEDNKQGSYRVLGKIERVNETTLFISELPVKKWTQDYKQFLETMMNGDPAKKIEAEIKDFKENHTDTTVAFTISATAEMIDKFEKDPKGLMGKFKLNGSLSSSNMNLFNTEGRIIKYNTSADILADFYALRLDYYVRRKELLLQKMRREELILINKARFIEEVCAGDLVVSNRKRSEILADLQDRGYDLMEKEEERKETEIPEDEEDQREEEEDLSDAALAKGYEYLLGMKIWSLTYEKAEELRRQLADKQQEVKDLEATSPEQIWLKDLDAIVEALDEREAAMEAAARDEVKAQKKNKKVQAKKKAVSKKKGDGWDSDLEDDSSDDEVSPDDEFSKPAKKPSKRAASKPAAPKFQPKPAAAPPKRALEKSAPIAQKPVMVAAPVAATSSKNADSDSDSDIGITASLAERMKNRLMVSPPVKRNKPEAQPSPEDGDDPFALDVEDFRPASVTPARTKAGQKPVKLNAKTAQPAQNLMLKAAPAGKKAPAKGRKKAIDLSDDSDDDIFGSGEEVVEQPARRATGRARGKVKYTIEDLLSDDEAEDSESDFEE
jgi:DNA topoisomerase-2